MSTISNNPNPFNAESVREIKVPLRDAKAITKDNGLDEVFFKVDNKEYVAFGKELSMNGAVPGAKIKFADKEATITHVDNEATGFFEGAAHGVKSTPGLILEGGASGIGVITGFTMGITSAVFGLGTLGKAVAEGGKFGLAIGIAVATVPAAIGGVYSLFKGNNYDTINTITK